jgi:hypothetical protein
MATLPATRSLAAGHATTELYVGLLSSWYIKIIESEDLQWVS